MQGSVGILRLVLFQVQILQSVLLLFFWIDLLDVPDNGLAYFPKVSVHKAMKDGGVVGPSLALQIHCGVIEKVSYHLQPVVVACHIERGDPSKV